MKITFLVSFTIISLFSFGQRFAISLPNANTFYKGIDNPINVVLEGYSCDSIIVTTDNGKIEKSDNCRYIFKADVVGKTNIFVYKKHKKDSTLVGSYQFRVKVFPLPTPRLAGMQNGEIDVKTLLAAGTIVVGYDDFEIDICMSVRSFSVFIVRNNDSITMIKVAGCRFTQELINEFQQLLPGDSIYFEDIIGVAWDKKERFLNGMRFIIKE